MCVCVCVCVCISCVYHVIIIPPSHLYRALPPRLWILLARNKDVIVIGIFFEKVEPTKTLQ